MGSRMFTLRPYPNPGGLFCSDPWQSLRGVFKLSESESETHPSLPKTPSTVSLRARMIRTPEAEAHKRGEELEL